MAETRVALAAVVVTGVVGVTGPLITWKATRDSGELSSRAQLVQADRADLRHVLDEAALVLRQRHTAIDARLSHWFGRRSPLAAPRVDEIEGRLQRMAEISEQLAIRLGQGSALYAAYSHSLADLKALSDVLRVRPSPAAYHMANARLRDLRTHSSAFFSLANRVAGSVLH